MEPAAKLAALLQAKVDAIDSFGFLQAPKATAAGIPSTYFSYASGGIVVPGLSLIAHNDTIKTTRTWCAAWWRARGKRSRSARRSRRRR